jgi:hypothetical protein
MIHLPIFDSPLQSRVLKQLYRLRKIAGEMGQK